MTLDDQPSQTANGKTLIYSTDEENLYSLSHLYYKKWITSKIYRCNVHKRRLDVPQSLGKVHSQEHELAQYEVWRTIYDPHTNQEETRFIGLYDRLKRAFIEAHAAAELPEELHSQISMK